MSLVQQNHIFIDPECCGSSVGYYLHISEYTGSQKEKAVHSMYATVVLADCSQKIDWDFSGDNSIPKIEAVITLLTEFKKKYAETEKMVKQLNK